MHLVWPPRVRGRSPVPCTNAVGAWPVFWAPHRCRGVVAGHLVPCECRGGVACPLHTVWPPRGSGWSPGARAAAVVAWPVPWAPCDRRWGVAVPLGPVWPPRGVAGPLAPCGRCGGIARPLYPVWMPRGRGRSPGPRAAAVGAWPVCWAPCGRRWGVTGPLGPVWPPWWHGQSPGPRVAVVGRGLFPGIRVAAMGAWPVLYAPCGRRRGVAGPLGSAVGAVGA